MLIEQSAQIMPSQDVEELRARIDKVVDIIVHWETQKQRENRKTGIRRDSGGCREVKD